MTVTVPSYGKIFNLGHPQIADLFESEVCVSEKVDGSQINAMVVDSKLYMRSHHKQIDLEGTDKLFRPAVLCFMGLHAKGHLHEGWVYRGETLSKPKHNTLAYDRVPEKNVVIFDISTGIETYLEPDELEKEASRLGLETTPQLFKGMVSTLDEFTKFLDLTSFLGGSKIEGIVFKNYHRFGRDKRVLMGKYVSESFKETHKKDWKVRNPNRADVIEQIANALRTPARWEKSVQHLRERGELEDDPKDIGRLFKEVNQDILDEEGDFIKTKLFEWGWKQIAKLVTKGMPQWYKDKLASSQFDQVKELDHSHLDENGDFIGEENNDRPGNDEDCADKAP